MLPVKHNRNGLFLALSSLLLFIITICTSTLAQYPNAPSVQWSTSIDIPKVNNIHEEDWALAVIETKDGHFLAAGFSQGVVSTTVQAPDRRLPGWVMVDPNGRLVADGIIDFGLSSRNGSFHELIEGEDGYYFIGKKIVSIGAAPKIALAKINKTSFAIEFAKTIEVTGTGVNGFGKGIDIVYDENGDEVGLVISGFEDSGNGKNGVIFKTDMNGNPTGSGGQYEYWVLSGLNDFDDEILDCKVLYSASGAPSSVVFTGYQSIQDHSFQHDQSNDPNDGITTYYNADGIMDYPGNSGLSPIIKRVDTDVIVGKISFNNLSAGPDFLKTFNSGPVEGGSPSSSDLFTAYPREFTNEFGPGTPGRSIDNNDPNCEDYNENPQEPTCCYSEVMDDKFGLNSYDRGAKILVSKTDGNILVSTWLNAFIIDGDPSLWRIQNNSPLLVVPDEFEQDHSHEPVISSDCNGFDYTHYYDAECYLLKVDIGDGSLIDAKHVAHLSGGDFNTPFAEEGDGSVVVGGTTSDKNFSDPSTSPMPDVDVRFTNFLIKTDADFNITWRHHFMGVGEGNCLFGMTPSQDGGYVVCGNTAEKSPVSGEEIENYSFVKLGPDCAFDEPFDIDQPSYTLTQSEVWTSDQKINSLIVVPAGLTLTIDGTGTPGGIHIEFAYSRYTQDFDNRTPTGIAVEKGGTLRVKGATLKGMNVCGEAQMWDGIMIKGDPAAPATSAIQGRMYISEDSRIENAIVGILMDEFSYVTTTEQVNSEWSSSTTGYTSSGFTFNTFADKGGGYLDASDSEILNCRDGIVFHPMKYNNLGSLLDIEFICNQPMADEYTFVENGAINGRRLGTRAFVTMVEVQNINFNQCSFKGNTNLDIDLRGIGIESFGSRYSVVGSNGQNNPTEFKDLRTGIETYAAELGPVGNSIDLTNNNFYNVLQGVTLRNSSGAKIAGNNFNQIPLASFSAGWGIYCQQSNAFSITFNDFSNAFITGYGVLVDRSSINGGLIEENTFSKLDVGSQFQNDNDELFAPCNTYQNIALNSWRVLEKATGAGALADQGNPDPDEPKADNRFIDNCPGTFPADIYSQFEFSYYDKIGNTHPAEAACVSPVVDFNFDLGDPSGDECVSFFTEPCPKPPCNTEERAIYDGSPQGIKDRNRLLRSFLHWDTHEITDSVELIELDSVINLLASRATEADKRLLVTSYLANEQYTEANMAMAQVSGSDQETGDFIAYHDSLIQAGLAGHPWYDLPKSTLDNLLTYKNATTSVAENAKMLDYYYNRVYSPLVPLDTIAPPQAFQLPPDNDIAEPVKQARVYPNPFNQSVTFEFSTIEAKTVTVSDLLGRILWQYETQQGEISVSWKPEKLAAGTYLYRIEAAGGQNEQGKLLYFE